MLPCLKDVLAQPGAHLNPVLVPGEDVCESKLSCPSLGHVHAVEDLECVGLKAVLACSTLTVSQIFLLLLLHHHVPFFFSSSYLSLLTSKKLGFSPAPLCGGK